MKVIGVVVPTTFSRVDYLQVALQSIKKAGNEAFVVLTTPALTKETLHIARDLLLSCRIDCHLVEAPGLPLSRIITDAIRALPPKCEYVTWLCDDDVLLPESLEVARAALDEDSNAIMVYGGCQYISRSGEIIITNKSSQFAARLINFGPQLIPQPGTLWRRSAFEDVGGLSSEFNLAFDFDLFLKLSRVGKLTHIDQTLAQFRWHPDSLSVKRRWRSVTEASRVRRKHYSGLMRYVWVLWEPWVVIATWAAGKLVQLRVLQLRRPVV